MKILLFYPPNNEEYGIFEDAQPLDYPLGLCYIAASLERGGHTVRIFDLDHDKSLNGMKGAEKIIRDEKPDAIGISCLTYNRKNAFRLARLAKSIDASITVIMGGVHATFYPAKILENFPVDYVVVGEADYSIVDLLESVKKGAGFENIPGIAFRKAGDIVVNKNREFAVDMDSLPHPAHHHFADQIKEKKWAHVMGSRGCPFGCNYCSTSYFWGRRTRKRSPVNVIDEVEHLVKTYGVTAIYFEDDTFSVDQEWAKEICREIMRRDLKIKWQAISRFNCISEELLGLMEKAGCEKITFGLESGAAKVLSNIHKGLDKEMIIKGFEMMKRTNIKMAVFLMVGNPGESEETIKETCEFLDKVDYHDVESVSILQLFPNTPFYHMAKERGLMDDDFWLKDDAPIPYYLAEHDLKTLQKYALQLILHCQRKKGVANFTKFSAKAAKRIAFRKAREITKTITN